MSIGLKSCENKNQKTLNKLNHILFVNNLVGQNIPDAHEGTEISLEVVEEVVSVCSFLLTQSHEKFGWLEGVIRGSLIWKSNLTCH